MRREVKFWRNLEGRHLKYYTQAAEGDRKNNPSSFLSIWKMLQPGSGSFSNFSSGRRYKVVKCISSASSFLCLPFSRKVWRPSPTPLIHWSWKPVTLLAVFTQVAGTLSVTPSCSWRLILYMLSHTYLPILFQRHLKDKSFLYLNNYNILVSKRKWIVTSQFFWQSE